ncbi:MAG: LemA family protein [Candidatus Shapirobacteria bacterium]|nr:LemA family protein [Candidatus Shapirobacteria bacterium]
MYLILGVILVLIVLYVVSFYNRLRTTKVRIGASIQEIGNQLKRQADLIPNLVESVKGYMTHEKGIFDQLTEARKSITQAAASNDAKQLDNSQELINKALGALRVIVESNPQIQASGLVTDLMNELRDTADKVMYARRTLIDLTADYNTAIETVPGIWLAPMFGFQAEKGFTTPVEGEFLQVNSTETETPKVNL